MKNGWNLLHVLSEEMPESFGGLSEELATNAATLAEWREWACSSEPENTALPGQWNTQLNSFQKMVSFVCFSKKKKDF